MKETERKNDFTTFCLIDLWGGIATEGAGKGSSQCVIYYHVRVWGIHTVDQQGHRKSTHRRVTSLWAPSRNERGWENLCSLKLWDAWGQDARRGSGWQRWDPGHTGKQSTDPVGISVTLDRSEDNSRCIILLGHKEWSIWAANWAVVINNPVYSGCCHFAFCQAVFIQADSEGKDHTFQKRSHILQSKAV